MPFRVDEAPGDIEGFWFAIDRAILREHGIALLGPPPDTVFAPIPRATLLGLLGESVRWHRGEAAQATASGAVLNSARALRFAAEGTWSAKRAAGEWLVEHTGDAAAEARGDRPLLPPAPPRAPPDPPPPAPLPHHPPPPPRPAAVPPAP